MTPSKKDQLRQRLACRIQLKVLELNMTSISGISAPPGCDITEVSSELIKVSAADVNHTDVDIKTPDGVRTFEVIFKEVL